MRGIAVVCVVLPLPLSLPPLALGGLRGANQSLVFSSAGSAGAADCAGTAASVSASWDAADAPFAAVDALSASLTGVRITTGGIGREPGMLIRMRVVSVVSVLGWS
jgi:hypothetical protein